MTKKHTFPILMVAPRVNINGDTADSLLEDHKAAMHAVRAAIEAVRKCAPHGRNYQTMETPESFQYAQEAYRLRLGALIDIEDDLMGVALAIHYQQEK